MLAPYKRLPRTVHVLCLGTFINRAGTLLLPFLTLYLTHELGFGVKFASFGMGALGLGSLMGSLLGGYLADRFGRRPVMLLSLFGSAAVLVLFSYLSSAYAIVATLVGFAVLSDMFRPAAAAMISDLVPADERPIAFGLMYFAINLGFPIGTVCGGMLAAHWFRGLFWADALTTAIYGGIILMFIAETLPARRNVESESTRTTSDTRAAVRHIVRDVPFLIFCAASMFLGLSYVQSFSTLPIFMQESGIGVEEYGRLIAINGVMIVLIQIPLTAWMKRYNRVIFVCLAAVITGLGFGATALATSAPFFAATIVVWTLGEIMIAPFTFSIVSDMAPVAYRARYLGVFTMFFSSANMLGAPLGGMLLAARGGAYLWGGTLVLGLLAAILFATIHRHIAAKS